METQLLVLLVLRLQHLSSYDKCLMEGRLCTQCGFLISCQLTVSCCICCIFFLRNDATLLIVILTIHVRCIGCIGRTILIVTLCLHRLDSLGIHLIRQ